MSTWPPQDYAEPRPLGAKPPAFTPTLCDRTYAALREVVEKQTKTLREVADGADVDWNWLRKFNSGMIPDPSVNRIEKLYFYLTDNRL